jgi:uncharacterized repeat protein (TIGR03803 family)
VSPSDTPTAITTATRRERTMRILLSRIFPVALVAIAFTFTPTAWAQYTETILHAFSSTGDGTAPTGNLILDANGNLYGTTFYGGANNWGTVYEISPGSGGSDSILYSFTGKADGLGPGAGLVLDAAGNLYGTTSAGGINNNGVVFELSPSSGGGWTQTVLYRFQGGTDGSDPASGSLVFDASGSLYGTTDFGGASGQGTVFKLSHSSTGWTERVIHSFTGVSDGGLPQGNLIFDAAGNLYGTASIGGTSTNTICIHLGGCGTAFRLSPGNGWHFTTIFSFEGPRGGQPIGGLVVDAAGNLFGTTYAGGSCHVSTTGCGTVFELMPTSQGPWNHAVLHYFTNFADGSRPAASLALDAQGNLFGTTSAGGPPNLLAGTVFELSPSSSGWTFAALYQFAGTNDGYFPSGGITLDASGNLYGVNSNGGTGGNGTAYELSPPAGNKAK